APERLRADRHGDRLAEIDHPHAALHAVGRLHRDRADAVLTKVLLDLADHVERRAAAGAVGLDAQRVVDFRQVAGLELAVDHRADDLDVSADMFCLCRHISCRALVVRPGCRRKQPAPSPVSYSASAPETTSMISRVIAACRTLFM